MPSIKRISFLIAAALAATMFAASLQASPAGQPSVSTASPATISAVLSATTFEHNNVFIAVCDSDSPACRQFLQTFSLNASLVKGGWTGGVKNMRSSEFYSLDATFANGQAMSKVCNTSGQSALEKASCQALTGAMNASDPQTPQLIMINRKSGAVKIVAGFTDQQTQSRSIVSFLKK